MPVRYYTSITIRKDEYRLIKELADALGTSVRGLVVDAVMNYYKCLANRTAATARLANALLMVQAAIKRLAIVRDSLGNPPEPLEVAIEDLKSVSAALNEVLKLLEG